MSRARFPRADQLGWVVWVYVYLGVSEWRPMATFANEIDARGFAAQWTALPVRVCRNVPFAGPAKLSHVLASADEWRPLPDWFRFGG